MSKVPARGPMRSGARLRLKPGDRRVAKMRAKFAASQGGTSSGLRTVLITVAVTLAVAGITSWTTLAATDRNVASANIQAEEEFKRNQKQAIYSDFLKNSTVAIDAVSYELGAQIYRTQHPKEESFDTKARDEADKVNEAVGRLRLDILQVRLVAADAETRAAADEVHYRVTTTANSIRNLFLLPLPTDPDDDAFKTARLLVREARYEIESFVDVAAQDLDWQN